MDSLPEIDLAMADYLGAITEAIEICRLLLLNVNDTQSNYQSMDIFLASISGSTASSTADFPFSQSNPFCTTTRGQFRQIHDMYRCTLQSVRWSHRRVSRKLKMVKALKKLSHALAVMVCGVGAAAAFGTGAYLLFLGILVGMASAGIFRFERKTWLAARASRKKQSGKTTSLLLLQEKLDAVAKGTFVLGQDLDTISSLVARLSDGIERENALARCCVERAEDRSSVVEMVNELRHSCSCSRRLVEELEEHVCMFLATIRRDRI